MFLGRTISKAKWEVEPPFVDDEIAAEALTDLKTSANKLSLWEFAEPDSDWKDLVLAVASSWKQLDTVDAAWLEREALSRIVQLENSQGETPVADLRGRHVDAVALDVVRLLRVAELFAFVVRSAGPIRRVIVSEITEILAAAVRARRLALSDLKEKVREQVQKRI
jgi:hypothetical protein